MRKTGSTFGAGNCDVSRNLEVADLKVSDIVELDRINMSDIIEKSGGTYSPEKRSNALKQETRDGSKVITKYIGPKLAGYLQYSVDEFGSCYVVSLQVHPDHRNGSVLIWLIRNFKSCIPAQHIKELRSSVHINNTVSVSLHKRLGFSLRNTENNRYKFFLATGL